MTSTLCLPLRGSLGLLPGSCPVALTYAHLVSSEVFEGGLVGILLSHG